MGKIKIERKKLYKAIKKWRKTHKLGNVFENPYFIGFFRCIIGGSIFIFPK